MPPSDLVLHEEEFQKIHQVITRLRAECNAKIVFLVEKTGQKIAAVGEI